MRFLQADFIFPISSEPVKNGILVIDDNGTIQDLLDPKEHQEAYQQLKQNNIEVEYYHGIICPGFINVHCHLELSHLKGKLTEKQKLPSFLREVSTMRSSTPEEIFNALEDADAEMVANGIVAVGDISNTDHTFSFKEKSRIRYFTFVEVFDFHPDRAFDVFSRGKELYDKLSAYGLEGSLVPHAPYTVSKKLLKLLSDFAYSNGGPICIHNQETKSENEMFLDRKGELYEFLNAVTPFYSSWEATGFNSLSSSLVHLPNCNKVQLVHNTFSNSEDINWAHLYSMLIWWCFCPNANRFIEDRLPDIPQFIRHGAKITIGTDSYASNWSLSLLDELKTIHRTFREIKLQDLLLWATLNGAQYLGYQKTMGSLEKGKTPGVNYINGIDLNTMQLTEESQVIPLI